MSQIPTSTASWLQFFPLAQRRIFAPCAFQDRMLLSGNYIVPLYHLGEQWIARNKHIGRPEMTPLWGFQLPHGGANAQ